VKEQLDAIEQQMARLEGELEETGAGTSTNQTKHESSADEELGAHGLSHRPRRELGEEEATSELQAVDELLVRLEEKRTAGGVDDSTYERLRSKYLKRKNELRAGN
jgi:peptidoglycan/xylan/chitin deacetylase (PgdA/CDA1 family)